MNLVRVFPLAVALAVSAVSANPPNVILMMTDDQGIGDFGVMGNELIETPHLDAFAGNSGSLSQFYVSPVCSPTRASLMTGRYNQRTRCIDTWLGRSMMDADEYTVAEALKEVGYATGIFGKWHLGDCYPMRPQDQGFDRVLIHRGGGLAQPSEPLDNERRYTDPILFDETGAEIQTQGFCTDVYFDAALEFIEVQREDKTPFFIYLPTNAPHGPYHDVPEDWRAHYMEKDLLALSPSRPKNPDRAKAMQDQMARIAAMISNEDENVGRLMAYLGRAGLLDNTLVIRMNDNGPNTTRYVGDLRGMKTHVHEGGIRSPGWFHWPSRIAPGTTVEALCAHIDIMPTILEACAAEPGPNRLDGLSLFDLLTDPENAAPLPDRPIVIQSHRGTSVQNGHHCMIRQGDWKLVNPSGFGLERLEGEPQWELYELSSDPGEANDLAAERPQVLARLKATYDTWYEDVSSTRADNYAPPRVIVGTTHEPVTALTRQDWLGDAWRSDSQGHWVVEVPELTTFDIDIIFVPELVSGGAAEISFQVGAGTEPRQIVSPEKVVRLEGVALPKGEVRLEATRREGDEVSSAYQLILHTRRDQ